jgi:hypothetical protein
MGFATMDLTTHRSKIFFKNTVSVLNAYILSFLVISPQIIPYHNYLHSNCVVRSIMSDPGMSMGRICIGGVHVLSK